MQYDLSSLRLCLVLGKLRGKENKEDNIRKKNVRNIYKTNRCSRFNI